jgi:ferredoxin
MSVARFHVFSGTGNARYIALELALRLEARGFSTRMIEVSAASIARNLFPGGAAGGLLPEPGDIDLFLFPVYAMSMPRLAERYMKSLGRMPAVSGPKPRAAILSINGRISDKIRDGHEGQSLAQAERVLRRRGWDPILRETFDYPHNVTTIGSASAEERRAAIVALMEPRIESVALDLAAGRERRRPCRAWALLVGWPFGWAYRLVGRRMWGLFFAADRNCDGCGLCAASCPAGAIRMIGSGGARIPGWSYACEGCERCMNLCPRKAIQTSALRVALVLALCLGLGLPAFTAPIEALLGFLPGYALRAVDSVLSILIGLALLRAVDLILVQLGRFRALRSVLAFGWTRWTRRYPGPRASGEDA